MTAARSTLFILDPLSRHTPVIGIFEEFEPNPNEPADTLLQIVEGGRGAQIALTPTLRRRLRCKLAEIDAVVERLP